MSELQTDRQNICPECGESFQTDRGLGVHRNTTHSDKPWRDPETLQALCVKRGLTVHEAGDELGCAGSTVHRWLAEYDIEFTEDRPPELGDADQLRQLYVSERLTTTAIADRLGCTASAVNYWLEQHDIPIREGWTELEYSNLADTAWLREQYVGEQRSLSDIAADVGCSHVTVGNALRRHDIETRDKRPPEPQFGPDHPRWNGGPMPYGEGWTERKKERVRESQDRRCADCGATAPDGRRLDVHHLRKAREFDDPEKRNAESNLVALCPSCHRKWERMYPLRPHTGDE
jgi:5-methylcytosine-specific restriction endonuclease McrA/predicted transcriptional regulator